MAEQTLLSDGQTLFDPSQWYSKKESAAYVGTTERTIERWVSKKLLHPLMLRRPAQHPQSVFAKTELDQRKQEEADKITPTRREPLAPTLPTPRQADMSVNGISLTKSPLSTVLTSPTPPMSDVVALALATILFEKGSYLTLKEARELTRWSESALKQAVEEKRIQRGPGRTWLLRTVDLLQL